MTEWIYVNMNSKTFSHLQDSYLSPLYLKIIEFFEKNIILGN